MITALDKDKLDKECVSLVNMLNTIDGIATTESCCGHLKAPYRIFFVSDSFSAIGMLYRCVDKRYSDGNWKIEVCCSDTNPTNGFLLTSVKIFETEDEMMRSVNNLINNITYWNGIQFKDYFKEMKSIDDFKIVKQDKKKCYNCKNIISYTNTDIFDDIFIKCPDCGEIVCILE